MPYDHSTKIGNEGDLIKHIVLFRAIQQSLNLKQDGGPFQYAESNAGRPQYVLPKMGGWGRRIGKFSTNKRLTKYRAMLRKRPVPEIVDSCVEFDSEFIGRRITTGMTYPGSVGLAFRLLRENNVDFRMMLWELDVAAADECVRFFYPWRNEVDVKNADGYSGLMEAGPIDLALIDPPSLSHAKSARDVMSHLDKQNSNFVCWMPRTKRPKKQEEAITSKFSFRRFGGRSRAARRVKFPPANRS